jgi:transposase InsO family protein
MIMHTDRRNVYCGLAASISGCGNCYDNSVVESFFISLKVESVHGVPLMDPDVLGQALFENIEVEYNRTSYHSAFGYRSPEALEARIVA